MISEISQSRIVRVPSEMPTTILIVDDNQGIRNILTRILQKGQEFSVVGEAEDGSEALELARALSPDLILMDLAMPRVNGLEATRRIKVERPGTKVIILTRYEEDAYRQAATQSGADAFLSKGTRLAELLATIRQVLQAGPNREAAPA
ncbi:MAG TPA: response regulator transcription factor [Candidatus Methylomirabilis sp.]|nr:response regulator transcription factor [Candidatus Methylomirabilis sp.]